jgi:DNA-binding protein YbaB
MSNEIEQQTQQPSDQSIAIFLQENDMDGLTDILVEALNNALSIMEGDIATETLH